MTQFAMQFEGRFFAGAEAKKASKPPKHKISDTSRLHLASDCRSGFQSGVFLSSGRQAGVLQFGNQAAIHFWSGTGHDKQSGMASKSGVPDGAGSESRTSSAGSGTGSTGEFAVKTPELRPHPLVKKRRPNPSQPAAIEYRLSWGQCAGKETERLLAALHDARDNRLF